MTIGDWLRKANNILQNSGCPDPEIDARWIAEDLLHMTAAQLRFESENDLPDEKTEQLDAALSRRASGEPVQYILERADFMGLQFYVDHRVLIPRQDTETLVENAIIEAQHKPDAAVLDLCTGSGAIGLSIKSLVPHINVTMTDMSHAALEVAKKNAHLLGIDVSIRHGDLFKAVGSERFDLILSNPPYIPSNEMSQLQKEVTFEPTMALDGGIDGLDFYRRILADAQNHLNADGMIYLEVGMNEARQVLTIGQACIDCADSGILCDLNGIERIVWIRSK